ncbi:MAG: hypothetical protein E6Q40_09610, partial [Cupriavidus sp.]
HTPNQDVCLGIAGAHALTAPGQVRTIEEIAAFAGCTKQAIHAIEQKALRKIRRRLVFRNDPRLVEILDCMGLYGKEAA